MRLEGNLVRGGQRLDAADARYDLIFEFKASFRTNSLEDAKGAVVKTGVAPDEERATALSR